MKTHFSSTLVVTALAVGTLGLLSAADAGPLKAWARFRHSDGGNNEVAPGSQKKARFSHPAPIAAPSGYPHYQLIDLGTLGGPASSTVFPARALNNRGQMIAFAETGIVDPNCYLDCYFMHGFLRQKDGNIIDLPFPAGIDPLTNASLVGDMTANGLLSGFVTNGLIDPLTDFPQTRPVIWDRNGGKPTDLGTFGGNGGQAAARNQRGDTVGVALNDVPENPDFAFFMNGFLPAATQARAFLWRGNGLEDLGTLGGADAFASAINESGLVYGLSYTDTEPNETTGLPTIHPFLCKNGRIKDLGSLGGTFTVPGSISYFWTGPILNQRGEAIGTSTLPGDEFWHAFVYTSGEMRDLGTLGGYLSEALAINEAGLVVGRADFSPDSIYHHAVSWQNGVIRDLGVVNPCQNSTATSVNSAGDMVVGGLGACTDDPEDQNYFSAFLWQKGKPMADLNSLVSPASNMHIEFATAINDRGEIVGNAYAETGDLHVILLLPANENTASH
jgi:probable HAF family extracellular repeat protein